jgi:hypothetical protein
MKRVCLLLSFTCAVQFLFAQNMDGTWIGMVYNENQFSNRYIYLEIKQKDRAVWGVFSTTAETTNANVGCLCSTTGQLAKDASPSFELFLDKKHMLKNYNENRKLELCDIIAHLDLHYILVDSIQYLTGKWFYDFSHAQAAGSAAGYVVLQRFSTGTIHEVDSYFSNVAKMIQKGAMPGKTVFIRADDISVAPENDKKLIALLKRLFSNVR